MQERGLENWKKAFLSGNFPHFFLTTLIKPSQKGKNLRRPVGLNEIADVKSDAGVCGFKKAPTNFF